MWQRLSVSLFVILSVVFARATTPSPDVLRLQELIDSAKYQEARILAETFLDDESYGDQWYYVYSKLGDILYFQGDLTASLSAYLKALDFDEIYQDENLRTLEETNSYIGFLYREFGLDSRAEDWFRKALEQSSQLGDSVEMAVCYYNLSTVLLSRGLLDSSMAMLQQAYEIDLIRKDTSAIGFDLQMMGRSQMTLGKPGEAISYFKQSIDFLKQSHGNMNSLGERYASIGDAFTKMLDWDSATFYSDLAIKEFRKVRDTLSLNEQLITASRISLAMGDLVSAKKYAEQARSYFQSLETNSNQILANGALIDVYIKDKKYALALTLVRQNQTLADELGLRMVQMEAVLNEADIYQMTGRFEEALLANQRARVLEESLDMQRSAQLAEELRVRYNVDNMEHENQLLKAENRLAELSLAKRRQEQLILVVAIIVIVFIAVLVGYFIYQRSKLKEELLSQELENLRLRINSLVEGSTEGLNISQDQLNKRLINPLTEREFEILMLAVSDKNNSEIAEAIFVSVNTVKYHLKNIYEKLGVTNRKEALQFAINPK